jgi:hypothetical protein
MAYTLKEGQGSLFKNNKKQPGTPQPDYTGKVMINGQEMRVAGWSKQGKDGSTYLSLKVSEAEKKEDSFPTTPPLGNDLF